MGSLHTFIRREAAAHPRPPKVPPHYAAPPVIWERCAGCGQQERTSAMARRGTASGLRRTLCFDCYLGESGGAWDARDEYWDGHAWVHVNKGR